jgi:hypothetical protein
MNDDDDDDDDDDDVMTITVCHDYGLFYKRVPNVAVERLNSQLRTVEVVGSYLGPDITVQILHVGFLSTSR